MIKNTILFLFLVPFLFACSSDDDDSISVNNTLWTYSSESTEYSIELSEEKYYFDSRQGNGGYSFKSTYTYESNTLTIKTLYQNGYSFYDVIYSVNKEGMTLVHDVEGCYYPPHFYFKEKIEGLSQWIENWPDANQNDLDGMEQEK